MPVENTVRNTGKRDLLLELLSLGGISLLAIYLASISGFMDIILLFLSVFTGFGFLEYCLHRFAFHLNTKNQRLRGLVYKIHGVHHKFPSNPQYYKTSVYLKIVVILMINLAGYAVGGGAGLVFCSGFGAGYAFYLGIHFMVHHFDAPTRMFRFYWLYHEIHHHINQKKAYGVSNPVWDLVFNTYPGRQDFKRADGLLKNESPSPCRNK